MHFVEETALKCHKQ